MKIEETPRPDFYSGLSEERKNRLQSLRRASIKTRKSTGGKFVKELEERLEQEKSTDGRIEE